MSEHTGGQSDNSTPFSMQEVDVSSIFKPFRSRTLELKNRVVMAPMSRYFSPSGVPPAETIEYYGKRAAGGVGLIFTEGCAIDHLVARNQPGVPYFYGDALAIWKQVAARVHQNGGRIMAQLWHGGLARQVSQLPDNRSESIGPSGIYPSGQGAMRAMTQQDIEEVIEAFGSAAASAQRAGFDGVNIHGAHGYLIDEFFWSETNHRNDRYNGSAKARATFGSEIVREVRRQTSSDFSIVFRFSQWKSTDYGAKIASSPAELEALLGPLVDAGVDIFDASTRRFWLPEFEGSDLNLAGWAKKVTGLPTISVGSVSLDSPRKETPTSQNLTPRLSLENLVPLTRMLERGDFDLIAIGRALLANPNWPNLVKNRAFEALKPFHPGMVALLECSDFSSD